MSKKLHKVDNDTSDYILRAASTGAGKSRSTVVLIENNAIINNCQNKICVSCTHNSKPTTYM